MTTVVEGVFLDTNVLLTAVTPAWQHHRAALAVLNDWPARGLSLSISSQVLREWMVVATRPPEVNGLGLSVEDALFNARAFRSRLHLLEETPRALDRMLALVELTPAAGKQIHDAQLVATALEHGVRKLRTADVGDFARFGTQIEVMGLGRTE